MRKRMVRDGKHLWRGLLRSESGQMLPMVAVMLTVLLAMVGFALDVGRSLYTYRMLQASTDAAALAGAAALPSTNAVSMATQYSGVSGNLNANGTMPNVSMVSGYPKTMCLSSLTAQGMDCAAPSNANAVQVREQITLSMTFLKVIGKSSLTLGAVSTASSKGASRPPYNVAIIMDTTLSMGDKDTDPNCNDTQQNCALAGARILLENLSPCAASLSTCGAVTNGNVANPVDRVALYTFPPLKTAADVTHESDCSGTTVNPDVYTESTFGGPLPIYQVVNYSSDYKTSANATTLNPSSSLVRALGGGGAGCPAMQTLPQGTYIGGAMYQAGYDLINLQSSYPNSRSVVIIITDGDMNADYTYIDYPQYGHPEMMPNASRTSGQVYSTLNQCQQAVTLAGMGAGYNIQVYSVAYGALTSGHCYSDNTGGGATVITPCQTVQRLASSPQNFYSDHTASGGSSTCVAAAHPTTALNSIFQNIATSLSSSRLIPDNTT